jgi:hypothetical protein
VPLSLLANLRHPNPSVRPALARTGPPQAHLWDGAFLRGKGSKRPRGRQVYLGSYASEEAAARVYDAAALLFRARDAPINVSGRTEGAVHECSES